LKRPRKFVQRRAASAISIFQGFTTSGGKENEDKQNLKVFGGAGNLGLAASHRSVSSVRADGFDIQPAGRAEYKPTLGEWMGPRSTWNESVLDQ
jgi:hypothetical protein